MDFNRIHPRMREAFENISAGIKYQVFNMRVWHSYHSPSQEVDGLPGVFFRRIDQPVIYRIQVDKIDAVAGIYFDILRREGGVYDYNGFRRQGFNGGQSDENDGQNG
ncbi:MAG: hypothetical protein HY579_13275 [Nitrospinae bacterium]|nr:hypothetical protein [Nitrospinota bacterium]